MGEEKMDVKREETEEPKIEKPKIEVFKSHMLNLPGVHMPTRSERPSLLHRMKAELVKACALAKLPAPEMELQRLAFSNESRCIITTVESTYSVTRDKPKEAQKEAIRIAVKDLSSRYNLKMEELGQSGSRFDLTPAPSSTQVSSNTERVLPVEYEKPLERETAESNSGLSHRANYKRSIFKVCDYYKLKLPVMRIKIEKSSELFGPYDTGERYFCSIIVFDKEYESEQSNSLEEAQRKALYKAL